MKDAQHHTVFPEIQTGQEGTDTPEQPTIQNTTNTGKDMRQWDFYFIAE